MSENYHQDVKNACVVKLRNQLKALPPFLGEFFRGVENTKSARTKLVYSYDLKLFFSFLVENCPKFDGKPLSAFTLEDFKKVDASDIEEFMEYTNYYVKIEDGVEKEITNDEKGKSRKLSAVKTMFAYYFKKERIDSNPADRVDYPKLHDKAIVRLEINEVAKLLDQVESGENLTQRQQKYHELTKKRDLAIITLLLGTGIRVSECVGINIEHIDFDNNGIKVVRKGGNESNVYFGAEVEDALRDYMAQRLNITPFEGSEHAFFLSMQNKRITDRAVQNLVKKYTKLITSIKKITPHKLRSTYGTNLYLESGDIYLVADALGHNSVNTTKKYYAQMTDEHRRKAVNFIKLR